MRQLILLISFSMASSAFAQEFMLNSHACKPQDLIREGLASADVNDGFGSAEQVCRAFSKMQVECAHNVVVQNPELHNQAGFLTVLKGCVEYERMRYEEGK